MKEIAYYNGFKCVIAPQIKKQKKTSKYKLINWLYKKIYGYEYESTMPEDVGAVFFENKLIFRNKELFDKLKDEVGEDMKMVCKE